MSTPFKMKGFPQHVGVSPMNQDQEAIQRNVQNTATHTRRRHKLQLHELGYFEDEGKMVHPFGKGDKMDKAKWNEWKSKDENKPYKGKTKGLIE